ncbi:MAG: glycosyltransferase family 2 protein [Planctomycetota bacterium]|jgi:glycosyltransferase involved in cell wall biosynthesis
MVPLSVIIPCCNNEEIIRECIESVKPFADEIFVVDSGSTDRTREIAAEYTDRVVEHEYVNSATQKNWAIPQAKNEWVMIIDTDERATPELQAEIKDLFESEPEQDGYTIHRQNHFFGAPIHHCGWERDDCLRIFQRDHRYEDKHVHADVIVPSGKVGHLKGKLTHYTIRSWKQYMGKFDQMTTWAAEDRLQQGRSAGLFNLFLRPVFRFFKMYILRRGFLDGLPGLILCMLAAFSVFLKYAKLWALLRTQAAQPQA